MSDAEPDIELDSQPMTPRRIVFMILTGILLLGVFFGSVWAVATWACRDIVDQPMPTRTPVDL